ncbi:MAG: response regulator, partial [Shewanella sp.]
MNILIIDDQKFIRETLKADIHRYLTEDDIHIYEASNGNQGIELLMALDVSLDLVTIDLKMEQGDGIAVINMLATTPRWLTVPIAVISSSDKRTLELVDCIIHTLRLNLVGVFAKPVNASD